MEDSTGKTLAGINWNLLIWVALIFVVWRFSDNIFGMLGLYSTEGDEAGEKIESKGVMDLNKYIAGTKKEFPKGIPKGKTPITINSKDLQQVCKDIHEQIQKWNTDESSVISLLKRAKTKGDIAVISEYYAKIFKSDLYTDIKDTMNQKEQKIAFGYLNSLPSVVSGTNPNIKK